ncbi:MAG TPA: hypothetical protein VGL08_19675 [Paraburkholderia sp.]|jgi:hypothetical protein
MTQYRLNIALEAFQLPQIDDDVDAFHEWAARVEFDGYTSERDGCMAIETPAGAIIAEPGDWIVKGADDVFYSCKPDVFTATHEPIPPATVEEVRALFADAPVASNEAAGWNGEGLHPDTFRLVRRFTGALAAKLLVAQRKYGYGASWADDDWQDKCRADLMKHIAKGDPRDVAAYCAFMWHHSWPTAPVAHAADAAPALHAGGGEQSEMAQRHVIEGTVRFMRRFDGNQCACCPPGAGHIFGRRVEWDKYDTRRPEHFGSDARVFVNSRTTDLNENEGKRVRLTVEVIDTPATRTAADAVQGEPVTGNTQEVFDAAERVFHSLLVLEMSELCDRNSPEDDPNAMVANDSEMAGCIERALERTGLVIISRDRVSQVAIDEPVAWRHSHTLCLCETQDEVPLADGDEWAEPLYTSPPIASNECEAIREAVHSLSVRADELKESNTSLDGTWCDADEKAVHEAEVGLIDRLRALLKQNSEREPVTATTRHSWAVNGMKLDPNGSWVLAGHVTDCAQQNSDAGGAA